MDENVVEINKTLGGCPYDERIFPTTVEQVGAFLREKGLSENNIAAISGCVARLGWNNAILRMIKVGYILPTKDCPFRGTASQCNLPL